MLTCLQNGRGKIAKISYEMESYGKKVEERYIKNYLGGWNSWIDDENLYFRKRIGEIEKTGDKHN